MTQTPPPATTLPHHKLFAYELCLSLVKLVAKTRVADAQLRAQARKSAASAALNCAEGAARQTRADKSRAYAIALCECCEACAAARPGIDFGEKRALFYGSRLRQPNVIVGESMEGWPAHALIAQLYVENSDEIFKRALAAGATEMMPMTDMFFGSREGRVSDPFGNVWTIATQKEVVSHEEMQRRLSEQAGA